MPSQMQVKTIVVALDGSDHAYKALDFAADLAEKYSARLIALNVLSEQPLNDEERHFAVTEYHVEEFSKLDASSLMDVRGDPRVVAGMLVKQYSNAESKMRQAVCERLMSEARARAKSRGIENLETLFEEGDPATNILATAKDKNADLIILGSRGLSDLKGLLMGSVSHKVSQLAECTCITVK
ncbi:MAG: universal stress protein [Rhodospirillaceae bacterium]|nr:universal stress protein [Rhodospirillaceae bacterium]MBT5243380.1 universal stress protein [Rhodospirillaceae bacterium]MBT5561285.1 universal stress protein [Rhodospirillaceae bacterium]MBT6243360.1 universal stress protein [Rhodospirillaceae bacterium]MBT7139020.1 universal stress protein [Rhodospirillaceae bacterium]